MTDRKAGEYEKWENTSLGHLLPLDICWMENFYDKKYKYCKYFILELLIQFFGQKGLLYKIWHPKMIF